MKIPEKRFPRTNFLKILLTVFSNITGISILQSNKNYFPYSSDLNLNSQYHENNIQTLPRLY